MNDVVDSYQLSPMQLGMLFHAVSEHPAGIDIEQIVITVREPLDLGAFEKAWRSVVARYAILRTRFRWQDVAEPCQEVLAHTEMTPTIADWRDLGPAAAEERFDAQLRADRGRDFDLSQAPMMRLFIAALPDDEWRVLWTFHHALLDGRSFAVVLRELFALYDAGLGGETIDLPAARPYREYIECRQSLEAANDEEFWRAALGTFSAPTPLTIGAPTPGDIPDEPFGSRQHRLTPELSAQLRDAARDADVTVNTMVQAAWAVLLHRYSGESDIVFGATRAGRRTGLPDADDMVGLFINTLPVRVDVDDDAETLPWLRSLRTQQVAVRGHEHTPLASVQAWSGVARGTPLFESAIVYDHQTLDGRMQMPERHFEYMGQTNFPLVLIAYGDDEMLLRLEYSTDRFSAAAIERMLAHLVNLLRLLACGDTPFVRDLDPTSAEERAALVGGGSVASFAAPGETLDAAFARQVAANPEAIALSCETASGRVDLSYAELDRRAEAVAAHLRGLGIGPDQLVGLRVERSADVVVGILAILKSGGAYLPLDPVYPSERIAFMLSDAVVRVVLTQRALAGALAESPVECVCLDEPLPAAAEAPPAQPRSSDDLAYVIYTSGSTGKPKGVRVTHRNVLRLFAATDPWFGFGPQDVWTLFHSYAFDFSVWEIWGALLAGGRVVVVPLDISRDPATFRDVLISEQVTVLSQTPTAFRALVDADRSAPQATFALRYVVFGGEALQLQSLQPWFDRYGDDTPRLINMYGITETTVHVTYRPICTADLQAGAGSVIGIPIPDLRVYLLDANGQPVPVGVAGEMFVAGDGVADGYLQRPELTEQRFVPDPFHGGRMYRTGDLARRLESGELEYLGRIDQQVKIRGFRIELGEIEAAISAHPAIRQVAVIDREDTQGEKRLVAYLVTEARPKTLISELRDTLRTHLPEYMVPAHFLYLDALPLTNNGKLDRKSLPAPHPSRNQRGSAFVAPRNTAEETIADVWKAVLRVDKVGVNDHFFELGGDSILSIQVIARCNQRGLGFTTEDLFKHPTVAQLAEISVATPVARTTEENVSGTVPLTPIQSWFFQQDFEEAHHWNQAFLLKVAADFDTDALERAFPAVLAHHDALRLRYERSADGWTQRYGDATPIAVECVDLSHTSADERPDAIAAHATHTQGTLDLAAGRLLRAVHFSFGAALKGRLLLVVHHLVVDGVSWRILLEDLETAYVGAVNRTQVRYPDKSASMRTWSERVEAFARTPGVLDSVQHWRTVTDVPATTLPADGFPSQQSHVERVRVGLSERETHTLLQQVPKAFRTQINDVLLSSLASALQTETGAAQQRIDLEGHGREHIGDDLDVSRTIGWFTTMFPVALDVSATSDPIGRLLAVRDQLGATPHRGMSYGVLRYAASDPVVRASLDSAPRSEVLFNYLGRFDAVVADSTLFAFADESTGPWRSPRAHRTHALEVIAVVRDGRLEVEWHFDTGVHRHDTIARVAESMLTGLRELLTAAEDDHVAAFTPADFPAAALDPESLARLLVRYPGLEDVYPLTPMQRLFFAMDTSASRIGFEQWQFRIDGSIDTSAFRRAVEDAVARHSVLRTAFVDDIGAQPVQVVLQSVALPWAEHDWRALSPDEQAAHLQDLLHIDAANGFDLATPPMMRVALCRTGEQMWHLVWSTHHLCIDGWSWPVVFRDISRTYAAYAEGGEPAHESAISFHAYADWLANPPESETFWRSRLHDFKPTPMRLDLTEAVPAVSAGQHAVHSTETVVIDSATTAALTGLARRARVTPNVVLNAAWALLLSHYADSRDVVFGASFSGRPAELTGVESMVGPCVNNLPVRVAITPGQTLASWLAELQQSQIDLTQHQYAPLEQIQQWAAIPWRYRLFDSLIVFQNYQVDDDARHIGADAELTLLYAPEATNYPLTVAVSMGEELRVRLIHQPHAVDVEDVQRYGQDLGTILRGLADDSTTTVDELLARLPREMRGRAVAVAAKEPAREVRYVAPTNDVERAVTDVWRELFGADRISLDDNFFDLGGHSLLLVRAHAQLRNRVRADLPIVALLQYPTVRALARFLAGGSTSTPSAAAKDRARKQREAIARQRNLTGRR